MWTLIGIGGGILIPLLLVLQHWRQRQHFTQHLDAAECRICKARFGASLYEIQGGLRPHDRQRLDAFQRRYARYRVHCLECDSINLCADNGMPMYAYPVEDE